MAMNALMHGGISTLFSRSPRAKTSGRLKKEEMCRAGELFRAAEMKSASKPRFGYKGRQLMTAGAADDAGASISNASTTVVSFSAVWL